MQVVFRIIYMKFKLCCVILIAKELTILLPKWMGATLESGLKFIAHI